MLLLGALGSVSCGSERFESKAPTCAAGDTDCLEGSDDPETEPDPNGSSTDGSGTVGPNDPGTDGMSTDVVFTDEPAASDAGATETDVVGPDEPEPGDCDEPTTGPVKAYFEIPGTSDADLGDYFRLPFPNDFYLEQGQLKLGDFPRKTALVNKFVQVVEEQADRFSASPTVIFRFSGRVDFESLSGRFHLFDITDPESVSSPPLKLLYSPSSGNYVCHNALSVRPAPGHGLEPGHTYAAFIDSGVLSRDGLEVQAPPQLQQVLADEPPEDPTTAELHEKFAPFRAYLDAQELAPEAVLNATVFSVGEVREPMNRLAADVAELDAPIARAWTLCDGETPSPCSDTTGTRDCGAPDGRYDEYHALVEIPIFQQGEPPYFNEGGEISYSGVVRSEAICMALTVPKGDPPADGFPLLLTSHGAGGSFRSHLSDAVAGMLSSEEAVGDAGARYAVLGYDGVQHGPRRGMDELSSGVDPDLLLFNILNPAGTLGTSLQGGIDVLSMARFAKSLPEQAADELGVSLNAERLMFWGHSQGAMQGAIALPYTDDVYGAVFSGLGAGFLQTMLLRTEPAIIPQTVGPAIDDPGTNGDLVFGGQFHPALALVQHLIDPADTLHHAERFVVEPVTIPLHVFQVYGAQDAYSPGVAQQSFAIAAGLTLAPTDDSATTPEEFLELVPTEALPVMGNVTFDGAEWTAGVRQYGPPGGGNGHFVAFNVPSARADIAHFLATSVLEDVPSIGR